MPAHVFIAEDETSIISLLKYNLEKDLRLQNFMKPWWLQAVLLKLDREDFCHALLLKGVKNFICENILLRC